MGPHPGPHTALLGRAPTSSPGRVQKGHAAVVGGAGVQVVRLWSAEVLERLPGHPGQRGGGGGWWRRGGAAVPLDRAQRRVRVEPVLQRLERTDRDGRSEERRVGEE